MRKAAQKLTAGEIEDSRVKNAERFSYWPKVNWTVKQTAYLTLGYGPIDHNDIQPPDFPDRLAKPFKDLVAFIEDALSLRQIETDEKGKIIPLSYIGWARTKTPPIDIPDDLVKAVRENYPMNLDIDKVNAKRLKSMALLLSAYHEKIFGSWKIAGDRNLLGKVQNKFAGLVKLDRATIDSSLQAAQNVRQEYERKCEAKEPK